MSYLDRTFCASPGCTNECGRKMTHSEEARKPNDAVVSWGYFCESSMNKFSVGDKVWFINSCDGYYDPDHYMPDIPGKIEVDCDIITEVYPGQVQLEQYDNPMCDSELFKTPEEALIQFAYKRIRKNGKG